MKQRFVLAVLGAGVVCAGVSAALASPAGSLGVLDTLEPGRWVLRSRVAGSAPETLCLANGRRLIQLRHPDSACEQVVIQDTATEVTVQYVCRGRGYGRTHIRRETSRLVQIETQGIANGLPFESSAEARRVGDCRS